MKACCVVELLLLVTFLDFTAADQSDCPPWFFPDLDNGSGCFCSGAHFGEVRCSGDIALLRIGN